jgi:hypothetical protein
VISHGEALLLLLFPVNDDGDGDDDDDDDCVVDVVICAADSGNKLVCRVSMRSSEFEGSLDFLCLQIRHGCDVGSASARASN